MTHRPHTPRASLDDTARMTEIPGYSILGRIQQPGDLRRLPPEELPHLAVEMRRFLIETLGRVGGHFAANLGTVELSLALQQRGY